MARRVVVTFFTLEFLPPPTPPPPPPPPFSSSSSSLWPYLSPFLTNRPYLREGWREGGREGEREGGISSELNVLHVFIRSNVLYFNTRPTSVFLITHI